MAKDSFWQTGQIVSLISSGLLILGAFLPWVKAGWLSYSGLQKDGMFTAIIGLIIGIILICKKSPKTFIIIAGFLSALVSFFDLANAYSTISNFETSMQGNMFAGLVQIQIGSGLYLTFLASIGLIVGGFMIKRIESKSKKDKSNVLTIVLSVIGVIIILFFLYVSYLGSQTKASLDYDLKDLDLEDSSVSSQTSKYLSGYGQKATETFYLQKGLARFQMKHSGSRNFAIWLMDSSGNKEELLVNEIGSFDGSKAVRIPSSGYYLLDVDASGSWSVSIS